MTGVMVLDKHEGITSFFAASRLRRICGERRVGHTGTLDPMASGVLPVLLGGATKFVSLLPDHDKAYRATFLLGVTTDTLDITGTVLRQRYVSSTAADVERALEAFRGRILQTPPMYSAVSRNGVRMYTLARQGIEVERESREIEIYSLTLTYGSECKGEYTIDVQCSAGTYIRSLVSDVGEALGCGAVLTALRRTRANGLDLSCAHTLEALNTCTPDELSALVRPVDSLLKAYPAVTVTEKQSVRFCHGGALDRVRLRGADADGLYRVYDPADRFLGMGRLSGEAMAVQRLLVE